MITASELPRLHACPASAVLRQDREIAASRTEANRGTAAHEYLYRLHTGEPREEALAQCPEEHRAYCESIAIRPVPGAETEVAWVYSTKTSRAHRLECKNREYRALLPHEIAGTCDLVIPASGERPLTVVDWKTTHDVSGAVRYIPQVEFYALAAAREAGVSTVAYEIVVIDTDGALHYPVQRTLDWEDLERIAAKLAATVEAVARAKNAARNEFVQGEHCRYCLGWVSCPPKRDVLQALRGTPQFGADLYQTLLEIERWAELGRGIVKQHVQQAGHLRLDSERVLRIDGRNALRVYREDSNGR